MTEQPGPTDDELAHSVRVRLQSAIDQSTGLAREHAEWMLALCDLNDEIGKRRSIGMTVEYDYEDRENRPASPWVCEGCGATTDRYDNGPTCETCINDSFAEGG